MDRQASSDKKGPMMTSSHEDGGRSKGMWETALSALLLQTQLGSVKLGTLFLREGFFHVSVKRHVDLNLFSLGEEVVWKIFPKSGTPKIDTTNPININLNNTINIKNKNNDTKNKNNEKNSTNASENDTKNTDVNNMRMNNKMNQDTVNEVNNPTNKNLLTHEAALLKVVLTKKGHK